MAIGGKICFCSICTYDPHRSLCSYLSISLFFRSKFSRVAPRKCDLFGTCGNPANFLRARTLYIGSYMIFFGSVSWTFELTELQESWFRSEHAPFQKGKILQEFQDVETCWDSIPEFHRDSLNAISVNLKMSHRHLTGSPFPPIHVLRLYTENVVKLLKTSHPIQFVLHFDPGW